MNKDNTPNQENSFLAPVPVNAMGELSKGVRAQEVQAALVVAKKFPRDQNAAFVRIMQACERPSLAKKASYVFQRGGSPIDGATIDLMEVVAQNWGNIQTGVVELEQREGESTMLAFAWDIETNAYDSKTFTVRHRRDTKKGSVDLTEDRDIYENNANFAARRKRACMEAVIPRDIVEAAREKCEETLKKSEKEPLADRIRNMVVAYAEMEITVEMIEGRLNHKLEAVVETEFVLLRKIYKSLRDGMSKRQDWFVIPGQADKAPSEPKRETGIPRTPKKPVEEKPPQSTETTPQSTTPPKGEEDFQPVEQKKETVTDEKGVAYVVDRSKPFESLKGLAKASGIQPFQVLGYAKSVRMAKPSHTDVGEMRESDLLRIIDSWDKILPELQKVQVEK